MKNQKTIFHLLFITMSTFCATNVIADVSTSSISNDDPRTLQSIASLQSLKQVQTSDLHTAPHVHELKNKYKVRSLFVESSALPMVDIQLTFNAGSARDVEVEKAYMVLPIWQHNSSMKALRNMMQLKSRMPLSKSGLVLV